MSLYKIGHILRDTFPFLWDCWSAINSLLFGLRYGKKLETVSDLLSSYSWQVIRNDRIEELSVQVLGESNIKETEIFFEHQPKSAYTFFQPHGFDELSLRKLIKDRSFLAFVVTTADNLVVGYVFLLSFFWGKCFRGYMTDYSWRLMGINKKMNLFVTDIADRLNMRTFGSIAPDNIASLKSAQAVNEVDIIKKMENGDYFVEYKKKHL